MDFRDILLAALSLTALIPAIVLHEVAHGWAALLCGDPTAKERGRLSLNPLRHVDPFMSVALPAILALSGSRILFGGAKPVPIDLRRCRNPLRAYWITAVAGPLCNLAQALLGALAFAGTGLMLSRAASDPDAWNFAASVRVSWETGVPVAFVEVRPWLSIVRLWLYFYCATNAALMTFNLIPVPPLDGSRVVTVLLRGRARVAYAGIERYGLLVVFALFYFPQTRRAVSGVVSAVLSALGVVL